jgi:hypothetical protein
MIWQKLNLIYLLVFGYGMFSENVLFKKIAKILFILLFPSLIILSVVELNPYEQSDVKLYTTEMVSLNKMKITFGFNKKMYSAVSYKIKTASNSSIYLIYRTNAYGLKLKMKLVLITNETKDTVNVHLIGHRFLPIDID